MSPDFIESRRAGLEQYLKQLVMNASDKILTAAAVDRFLELKEQMAKVRAIAPSRHRARAGLGARHRESAP